MAVGTILVKLQILDSLRKTGDWNSHEVYTETIFYLCSHLQLFLSSPKRDLMLMGTDTHREVYRMNISHKATAQSLFFYNQS